MGKSENLRMWDNFSSFFIDYQISTSTPSKILRAVKMAKYGKKFWPTYPIIG